MAQSPTPAPATPHKELSPADKKTYTELSQDLDTLLERYLSLLDEQQRLQEDIGRHFSSGFFSLARANNSCPPGRRYGADYYDERMKAMRKISITPPANQSPPSTTTSPSFTTIPPPAPEPALAPATPKPTPTEEEIEDTTPPPSPSPSPSPSASPSSSSPSPSPSPPDTSTSTSTTPPKPRNPLTWFGILTPAPLRSAQQSFTRAVDGPIPALAGVVSEMRAVEREVGRVRGLLGIAEEKGEGE
ncbi:hypothetical protein FQN53_007923 [Emmonsiellopsis sp. PD_33]|nr:hypothetical protein FQN53_007923 [Emmonsiellopsis sp. PD_33]